MSQARARPTPPVALTIAGTDSGGGAGIAADLHTFFSHGVFGTLVVTAVTAQNTQRVAAVAAQPARMVEEQLAAVLEDLPVRATKTGMLANAEIVEVVIARAVAGDLGKLVVDPVMVSTSGGILLDEKGRDAYGDLLAVADLVTPNLAEAEVLLGVRIESQADLARAAEGLVDLGARAALVTGGHLSGAESIDAYCDREGAREYRGPRIESANTHGTGCTLSAAIAARLALGDPLDEAIAGAKDYVSDAIAAAANWCLGGGPGPLDHRLGLEPPPR